MQFVKFLVGVVVGVVLLFFSVTAIQNAIEYRVWYKSAPYTLKSCFEFSGEFSDMVPVDVFSPYDNKKKYVYRFIVELDSKELRQVTCKREYNDEPNN